MMDKIRRLRADHLKIQHQIEFYPYQELISDQIIEALIANFRITASATPKDIEKLRQHEIGFEISRQGGKTTAVGHTVEFIETFFPKLFGRPVRIGIFAKQLDQAKISYKIVRAGMRKAKSMMLITPEQQKYIAEEENARQIVLPDGSFVVVAPISAISQIEGLALDLIIIDEAQLADDEIVEHSIYPMGKTTNAPRVMIGKAGTQNCQFRKWGQKGKVKKIYFKEVAKQRHEHYEKTEDARHLIYEQSVKQDIELYGEDSDYIQREYYGEWQIGTGQFTTEEKLDALYDTRLRTFHFKDDVCYAGIDTAKHPDRTVVTILRFNKDLAKKEILNWMELSGENYQDQFDMICNFLGNYKVEAVAIDSTSQGAFMPDLFEKHTIWKDEHSGLYRVVFSAPMKSRIYENLKVSINELLTSLPKTDKKYGERFRQEVLDLQQEYKGQLLSVKHPDGGHDDYPDSWALAEWAYAKWNESQAEIHTITIGQEKRREVARDDEGKVTDYWPGL